MWCVSLVFSILELISNFGSLDGRCVLYIKSDAAGMPVRGLYTPVRNTMNLNQIKQRFCSMIKTRPEKRDG